MKIMNLKKLFLPVVLLSLIITTSLSAQENVQIGKNAKENASNNGALYDYSKTDAINIKVMVWGYVKFPGQYIVPSTTDINQLLSLAGGPTPDAHLDKMKLFRKDVNNRQTIITFDYSDLLSDDSGLGWQIKIPDLQPGDILLLPGSPKWTTRDYLGIILTILSTLVSVAALIVYSRRY
jgi:protein involved in polysaccharide export with SLBB domain